MLTILENISPVFLVIALGFFSRKLGFLPDSFIQSANRLVYYVAIPILVFKEISRGNFAESFYFSQIAGTFLAAASVLVLSLVLGILLKLSAEKKSTFCQISYHGNLGYVGLAVVFYALGTGGRAEASVLAGFLILFQNIISISLFTLMPGRGNRLSMQNLWKFLGNPIILSTILGLVFSAADIPLPGFVNSTFDIVGEMALPLALLIIGGSLTPLTTGRLKHVTLSTTLKLLVLPFIGYTLFRILNVGTAQTLTAIILLASPSATVSYVMAAEMGGDTDMAATAVTISTAASIFTYTLWIAVVGVGA